MKILGKYIPFHWEVTVKDLQNRLARCLEAPLHRLSLKYQYWAVCVLLAAGLLLCLVAAYSAIESTPVVNGKMPSAELPALSPYQDSLFLQPLNQLIHHEQQQ